MAFCARFGGTIVFVLLTDILPIGGTAAQESRPPQGEESAAWHLRRAKVCYRALDLECAWSEIEAARKAPGTRDTKVQVLALSAQVALARGQKAEAWLVLRELLELEPDFRPNEGSWPPEWLRILEQVRKGVPDKSPPTLDARLPKAVVRGRPVQVVVTAEDRSGVGGVYLHVGPSRGLALVTRDGRRWTGTIPGDWVQGNELRLWVEATDLAGNGPGLLGSSERPLRVRILAPRHEAVSGASVLQKWWFWTGLAAGVAAVAVGVYYLGRAASSGQQGLLQVRFLWPSPYD